MRLYQPSQVKHLCHAHLTPKYRSTTSSLRSRLYDSCHATRGLLLLQAQKEAGDRLREDLGKALADKAKEYTIQPGVYRISDSLMLEGTEVSCAELSMWQAPLLHLPPLSSIQPMTYLSRSSLRT